MENKYLEPLIKNYNIAELKGKLYMFKRNNRKEYTNNMMLMTIYEYLNVVYSHILRLEIYESGDDIMNYIDEFRQNALLIASKIMTRSFSDEKM